MDKQKEIKEALDYFMNENLDKLICSNPRNQDGFVKLIVRPVLLRGQILYQIEEFTKTQAFHKNVEKEEVLLYVMEQIEHHFKSAEVISSLGSMNLLVSKKGTVTFKVKKKIGASDPTQKVLMSHNRKKHYVLEEGTAVPFLVELGVMTSDGTVIKSRYDKFRQINRFLEFIEEILPRLDQTKENVIIDFGCGKSYLTFAMYYYLKCLKGYPIRIVGLDLKKDVVEFCNRLSEKFGFENLEFLCGDIAGYEGVSHVDMVVTLHACDTATDYAIAKAVQWNAKVILSVPCCQHELNRQIENDCLEPILHYGLIKERISALLTDGIRAELLEQAGYKTQVLEFIDMEHTPKNIMIRALKQGKKEAAKREQKLESLMEELHVSPTLYQLFKENGSI